MNCGIERTLHEVQVRRAEEHLPLEIILEALHDAEYAAPPFFRFVDVPFLPTVPPLPKR